MKISLRYKQTVAFLCLFLCFSIRAQTGRFYSTESGLSSSLINQIFQDSRGFVWSATEYGLNRFDGLRFSNYWSVSGDSTSILNNYVRTLYEDSRRNLWVGCINGLARYDRESDCFIEVPMMRGGRRVFPHVTQVQELHTGEIWLTTTGQGMFRLDETGRQALSLDDRLMHANYNFQTNFIEDSRHHIWIGTEGGGLICYNPETQRTRVYLTPEINDNNISAILEDAMGNLFIGTLKQGLSRYDRTNDRFVPVPHVDKMPVVPVYCLALVDGQLLVGTDGQGILLYDGVDNCLREYTINSAPLDFSDGKIHALLEDKDKNLWVGLFQKGMVLIPRQEDPFEYYGCKSIYYNPIGQGCVVSLYQDSDHHLWVGADNEGVYELAADGKRLNHYRADGSPQSVASTVMCFFEDSEGNFWTGSYTRGLARMNRRTGTCEYLSPLPNVKVLSLAEDKEKNLYIATLGSGFYRYNLLSKELKHYESSKDETGDLSRNELANDWVNYLYCDSRGLLWLAHYKGISCFNPATGSFLTYNGENTLIPGCIGYALLEDAAGRIWAGTSEGLYRFDKESGEVLHFTTRDGLPNNVICGLCEDSQHDLWISTYKGVSKYETATGRFINYNAGDGLQGNEFTHGAFHKASSGRIYFGGVYGITSFLPESISPSSKALEVWITDFRIFDRPVHKNTLSGGEPVITESVQDATLFRLSHEDNTFTIQLSTLRFNDPEEISYQYQMEEHGNRWLTTEPGVNWVTYNNLAPGSYTFSVRALNHGTFSAPHTIRIVITPPWYATGWAFCLYALCFCLLLWGIVNNIRSRSHHRREILEREHAEELNEAKLQFFINISHEIRTPMTLIINPLEKLLAAHKGQPAQPDGEELSKTYRMIYRNAQRILRLINQLMDIRKLEKGQMHMKFCETDIVGFIDDVMQTFDPLAQQKHIRFSFEHDSPELKAWVDLNNFDKVLMNIFSNAFKYTPEEGEILVTLSQGEDHTRRDALRHYFEIVVTDNGIGINKEEIERIFERFYQTDNGVMPSGFGTGVGLHLSRSLVQLHHGTIHAENRTDVQGSRFIIRLPMGAAHLKMDELQENDVPVVRPLLHQHAEELSADADENRMNKARTRYRVLVVEDEEEIRNYLRRELSDEYKVSTCADGKEAYDSILKKAPDLVISDVMMPGMDGLTLCQKLKQNTNVNHIPVILLTAKAQAEERVEGMEVGADAYITKPFNTGLLKSTAANLIANRRLLRNKFSGTQQQEGKMERITMRPNDEVLIERIMKVVNERLDDPELNVEMLASEVGLSRVHIHRKLKELTNLSARDFIKNIRLQQAATLLTQEQKMSVSEVAYAVGYTNLSHFSNSFKEKYGVSPKEYMNNVSEAD